MEFIAILLGIKLFKKYWPVNGSYWNRLKGLPPLDPKGKFQLEGVIKESYEYTQTHLSALIIETIIIGTSMIMVPQYRHQVGYTYASLLFIHLYAFMVHLYNRRLAFKRLKLIPLEDKTVGKFDPYTLQVIKYRSSETWYCVAFQVSKWDWIELDPPMPSHQKASLYSWVILQHIKDIVDPVERAYRIISLNAKNRLIELLNE